MWLLLTLAAVMCKKIVCPMELVTAQHHAESSYDYAATKQYACVIETLGDLPATIAALLFDDSSASVAPREKQESKPAH